MKYKNIIVKNVNLMDVINERIINNVDLLICDGKISEISKDIENNKLKIIDLKGKYLLPGLINLHAHLFGSGKPSKSLTSKSGSQERLLKFIKTKLGNLVLNKLVKQHLLQELRSGTTTIRSVGDFCYSDVTQRDAINSGKYLGPTLYCSGFAITAPTGHGDGTFAKSASTQVGFEKLIDENIAHQVDWIKLCTTGGVMDATKIGDCGALKMTSEETKWCVEYAHAKGYRVCSHIEGEDGMIVGITSGLDTIEHGAHITDEFFVDEIDANSEKYKRTSLVTTLSPAVPFSMLDKDLTQCDEIQKANADIVCSGIITCAKHALKNGVNVGLGTDASCPFAFQYGMWRELAYFHKYVGVSNSYAIKTATIINAFILEKDQEIGSLEVGKYFDAFVVEEDPFINLKALANPLMVFKHGKVTKKKNHKNKKYEEILDKLI